MEISLPASTSERIEPRKGLWPALLAQMFPRLSNRARCRSRRSVACSCTSLAETEGPHARIGLERKRAVLRALFGGEHGAAKAFIDGDWTSPNLTETCRFFDRNRAAPAPPGARAVCSRRWNAFAMPRARTPRPAADATSNSTTISATSSSASGSTRTCRIRLRCGGAATRRSPKRRSTSSQRVADLAGDLDGKSVLEIGCGWGAQARVMASRGARVKGVTLSPSQLAFAQDSHRRGRAAGLRRSASRRLSRSDRPIRRHRLHRNG